MKHLLVTNDFLPKVGGIQSYLYELWSRLAPEQFAVLTTAYPGAGAFDECVPFRIERVGSSLMLPTPSLRRRIDELAKEIGAELVVLDPALPLGAIGPSLSVPYALVLHGAEVTVPARLPGSARLLRRSLTRAAMVIAAGRYPASEARRLVGLEMPETVVIPPGVDTQRFHPLSTDEALAARARLSLPADAELLVSVSRLVPRKGMDVLIEAAAQLKSSHSELLVAIAGTGRDAKRLQALVSRLRAPVRLLGRVSDELLPQLNGSADLWAMLCRNRWVGLEQEGFGIVFLEAAACAVPQVAGLSGGADEAVVDGQTGLIVDRPADVAVATRALARLLDDGELRRRLGQAGRVRAVEQFDYSRLSARLEAAIESVQL